MTSLTLAHVTGGTIKKGDYEYENSADVLEFTDGDGWSKLGAMRDARRYHGTSVVEFKDFGIYCT